MANQLQQMTHKQFLTAPKVQETFNKILDGRGEQFATSVLSIVQNNSILKKASNESIYGAAMKAAVLNLPIDQSLGYAYIVPFKGQAQFQMGYKGYIQLAQRSGLYKSITHGVVYKAQLVSYNPLFEELEIDFTQPKDEVAGYFASFKLLNGFEKVSYWTKEEVEAHGKRFSQSYAKGPWATDFDAMAQKTVLKSILSKYGPLSVDMQTAIASDNADSTINNTPIKDVTEDETDGLADLIGTQDEQELLEQSEEPREEPKGADSAPIEGEDDIPASDGNLFDNLNDLTK